MGRLSCGKPIAACMAIKKSMPGNEQAHLVGIVY